MAKRRRSNRSMKMQPAITDLQFTIAAGGTDGGSLSYVDTARELSKINRRLYSQSRMYAYQGVTFIWRADQAAGLASIEMKVKTAGNSWSVQNAHVKGHALWNEMQDLVLDDNPSVRGKWHDFKVKLVKNMATQRIIKCTDGNGVEILPGEWDYATYVMPEHDVDPVTGLPLDADEFIPTLIGIDNTLPRPAPATGFTGSRSLLNAYQQSRATVQEEDPNIPPGLATSFFNLLTDSGSQEPELATVIEDENNEPPYAKEEYVGGISNAPDPLVVGYAAISSAEVDGRIGGFVAPCGLLEIEIVGYDSTGAVVPNFVPAPDPSDPPVANMPELDIILHVAPGMYKGVAAIPMGQ